MYIYTEIFSFTLLRVLFCIYEVQEMSSNLYHFFQTIQCYHVYSLNMTSVRGMLVQRRDPAADQESAPCPKIKVRVTHGSSLHEVSVSMQATFGMFLRVFLLA